MLRCAQHDRFEFSHTFSVSGALAGSAGLQPALDAARMAALPEPRAETEGLPD
jgi:hypothetical protein